MLTFAEFKTEVKENIIEALPTEFADCHPDISTVTRADYSYEGLTIHPKDMGAFACPAYDLTRAYKTYSEGDTAMSAVIAEAAKLIVNNVKFPDSFDLKPADITKWEKAKSHIIPILRNSRYNVEYLMDKVSRPIVDDMVILYSLILKESNKESASVKITDHLLDTWGVSEDDLYDVAIANLKNRNHSFASIEDVIFGSGDITTTVDTCDTDKDMPLFVMRGATIDGASVILNTDLMDKLAEKFDFYILPSSTSEVIIMRKGSTNHDITSLISMVKEINETDVTPEERLADTVFEYDKETKTIRLANV